MKNSDIVILQAKASLADDLATELRLYRGYCKQFDEGYEHHRLFAPLEAYDNLFSKEQPDV